MASIYYMSSTTFEDPYRIDLDQSVADIFSDAFEARLDEKGLDSWADLSEEERKQFTDIDDFKEERLDVWYEMMAGVPFQIREWVIRVRKDVEKRRHPTANKIIDSLTENYLKAVFVSVAPEVSIGLEALDRVQDATHWVKRRLVGFLEHLEGTIHNKVNDEIALKGNMGTATFSSSTFNVKDVIIEEGREYFREEVRRLEQDIRDKIGELKDKLNQMVDYFVSGALYLLLDDLVVLENMSAVTV